MSHDNKTRGFTLIELMLSMTFVAVLLVAITMTIIMMSNIFNKGLTLKEVNQVGRSLTSDLQTTIAAGLPFDISGASSHLVNNSWGGRLCVGQYSYIWNYGLAISKKVTSELYLYDDGSMSDIPHFVKVIDPNASYCSSPTKKVVKGDAVELLNVGEHNLAVHSFSISNSDSARDSKTNQRLYSIEFTVGTNNQKALTNTSGYRVCKEPGQPDADPTYCSVVRFNIVALAGNSVE